MKNGPVEHDGSEDEGHDQETFEDESLWIVPESFRLVRRFEAIHIRSVPLSDDRCKGRRSYCNGLDDPRVVRVAEKVLLD